jgi:cyclopropane fatty-acyl-phospholipid synthase-like methyltransferase
MTKENNLEELLDKIVPSKKIDTTFTNSKQKLDYLTELKNNEAKVIGKFLKLSQDDKLLDFGVGLGLITEHLYQQVNTTYCYDPDVRMLDYCSQKFRNNKNIEIIKTIDDLVVDKITVNNVFSENYTFEQFKECMITLHNCLTPNGLLWFDFFDLDQQNKTNQRINKNFYSLNKTLATLNKIGYNTKLIDSRNVHIKILIEKV